MYVTYKNEIKSTITLSIPLVIGQLGHMMMSVTDNIMVGRVGAAPLAAASLGNGLFSLFMVVGFGISMAVTPLTAIAYGAGKNRHCGDILRQGLWVNMLSGIILCICTILTAGLIGYMDQPQEIVKPAESYLRILGFSMLPIMLFQTYRQFAEGVSVLKPAMFVTLLANLVNIAANWVFIYGNLGFPPMGLSGAGMATFSSRAFMAIAMMYWVLKSSSFKPFGTESGAWSPHLKVIRRLLKIGLPAGCQYFFEVSAFAGSTVIIGWIGTRELAAHQIALNLASITFMVAMGISAAATVRVGNAVGRCDIKGTRSAGFSAVFLCAGLMSLFGLGFIGMKSQLPALYISEKDVIEIAASLLVMVAFFQVSDGTQAVGLGILRGITDMKVPTLITFAAYWIIGLPSGYYLAFQRDMGATGVWTGLCLSLTFAASMMMIRFHRRSRCAVEL